MKSILRTLLRTGRAAPSFRGAASATSESALWRNGGACSAGPELLAGIQSATGGVREYGQSSCWQGIHAHPSSCLRPRQGLSAWGTAPRFYSSAGTVDVVVPSMGESVNDGAIAALLKGPGDTVAVDDIIAQIETDKVTIDVRSPEAGVIEKLVVKMGDTVTPGTVVAVITKGGAAAEAAPAAPPPAQEEAAEEDAAPLVKDGALSSVFVPSMGESMADGVVAEILKGPGDSVQPDELIAQIETDKVTIDVRSAEGGVIEKIVIKKGDTVRPGDKVALVSVGATAAAPSKAAPAAAAPAPTPPPPPPPPAQAAAPIPVQQVLQRATEEPKLIPKDRERRVPMTRLRRRVAQRLKDSQNTFALLTTFNEVDMTNLMQMRSTFKDEFLELHGVKLGFMSAFVKAAATALKREPVVNAVIDGDDVIYRDYVDISIAVGTPKGLVVPVIRNVDELSFAGIEKVITQLGKKAKDGTISIDDMAGGTFTISNGGVYGSLISTPIINPPQSAILGMHAVQQRPMLVGKEILPRPMMYVALTYDHRLIDGREAVLFLRRIKDVVEDPRRLLLDL